MKLLQQLNWIVTPDRTTDAPPPQLDEYDGGRNDKWAREIYNELESLIWQIEVKHWKSYVHIGRDLVKRLDHIPESFIRSIMAGITPTDYPALSRHILRGS